MRHQTTCQRQLPSEAIAACDMLCTTQLVQEDASYNLVAFGDIALLVR